MSRDDVIRWMQEVGAKESNPTPQTYEGFVDIFQHFAALVAAHEREACALLCDDYGNMSGGGGIGFMCAEAIRARGEVP